MNKTRANNVSWVSHRVISLNVYDLHSSNEWLHSLGMGVYHSGIVILEPALGLVCEYSFSSKGVVKTRPRLPSFGKFRCNIVLGSVTGSALEVGRLIHKLSVTSFAEGKYDLISRNCNHFTDEVAFALLRIHIPDWINRMTYLGSAFVRPSGSTEFEVEPIVGSSTSKEERPPPSPWPAPRDDKSISIEEDFEAKQRKGQPSSAFCFCTAMNPLGTNPTTLT